MFRSSETKVSLPVEDTESYSCENVTNWLENNRPYLNQPPAEHYIMTELYDRRLRNQSYYHYQQIPVPVPVPVFLPLKPVKLPCVRVAPMVPVYEKPLRKSYTEMAAQKNQPEPSKPRQTYVEIEPQGPYGYYRRNEPTYPQRLMPQTRTEQPVAEAKGQTRDTAFVTFF